MHTFHLAGLDCPHCAKKIENHIQQQDNVASSQINFPRQKIQVSLEKDISSEELKNWLQNLIDQIEPGIVVQTSVVIPTATGFSWETYGSLLVGTGLFLLSFFIPSSIAYRISILLSYFIIGFAVLKKALLNLWKRELLDENVLMAIATMGAIGIGDYEEAVAVMLFYAIGEILQSYAVNKTRSSITSLLQIKSPFALVKQKGTLLKKDPEDVLVGDHIVVKVGQRVPLDGTIIEGDSTLDMASLTGESLPQKKQVGDAVLAGSINLSDVLSIEVTKPYQDSTVAKIISLMEEAADKKAPIERFITRFARIYTPVVVILAILIVVIPMLIIPQAIFADCLYRGLTFLVISCPCALVISVPLGLYAGLGKASQVGVLIKGGNYLEILQNINTMVFDKTGTITKGTFSVIDIQGDPNILEYGAYGEYYSNHPIARSIVNSYDKPIDPTRITNFQEKVGEGVSLSLDGMELHLGNQKYMESLSISIEPPKALGTIVYIASHTTYLGSIVVADTLKDSAITGIRALHQAGIRTVMLSGDDITIAKDIGNRVGMDEVYGNLLPQDKVSKLEQIMQQAEPIAFIGDGINDAPVLARANVGIAMGGVGSDAAIEAANVVLMKDDITSIRTAMAISKKTNKILKQNIYFILFVKIAVLVLTVFGLTNMWMGVFADVGVTLLAILNALRILKL